jgi:hypothetical protein
VTGLRGPTGAAVLMATLADQTSLPDELPRKIKREKGLDLT